MIICCQPELSPKAWRALAALAEPRQAMNERHPLNLTRCFQRRSPVRWRIVRSAAAAAAASVAARYMIVIQERARRQRSAERPD